MMTHSSSSVAMRSRRFCSLAAAAAVACICAASASVPTATSNRPHSCRSSCTRTGGRPCRTMNLRHPQTAYSACDLELGPALQCSDLAANCQVLLARRW